MLLSNRLKTYSAHETTDWNSGVKAEGCEVYEYPFAPVSSLLCGLTIYGLFQNLLPYLAFTQGGIDLMYTGNTYMIIAAIGFVITVVVYEPLGQLWYDYFRGQGTNRKGASVEPVEEQREKDESQRSGGVGEADDRLLLGDADEDKSDVSKASSAKDDRGRNKSDTTNNKDASTPSALLAGTVVDDVRKSLGAFRPASFLLVYCTREGVSTLPLRYVGSRRRTQRCV